MFRSFFLDKKWFLWSIIGTITILVASWQLIELRVSVNQWYGDFYDMIQLALAHPNNVKMTDYIAKIMTFIKIASPFIVIVIILDFFTSHYVFRWRTAMSDHYMKHWQQLRHIEGASQRIQEDTKQFASIMESLGANFIRAMMTLIAFLPLLWDLSKHVTSIPLIGHVNHSLVYISILSAIVGTVLLAVSGIKLPGLVFNNQKVEAAYRKELVLGEDNPDRADLHTVQTLYGNLRKNYFLYYGHYFYFNFIQASFGQFSSIWPWIFMAPTVIAGVVTFGLLQRIIEAFARVTSSFEYLVNAWGDIIELLSIYKRLHDFDLQIKNIQTD